MTATRRPTAKNTAAADGHYLLVVKDNQKKLRRQLRQLPWRQSRPGHPARLAELVIWQRLGPRRALSSGPVSPSRITDTGWW
ncbi:hypothetical protein [Streptomyces sp. NPDC057877]|uniref:hypothetical protein n=1 Tax=Streptomyces sp. NPDC057877 TaxID=3346269 RepID=UPI0036CE95FB